MMMATFYFAPGPLIKFLQKVTKIYNSLYIYIEIAKHLGTTLAVSRISQFPDGEININIDTNVRGKNVFIIQPTCHPVNKNLMELLLLISTMKRSSVKEVTAVITYYGYARRDRKTASQVPISAADVAKLLETVGVDRVVSVDLHC